MLLLVASVQVSIVGVAGLKHLPKYLQQPLAQAAQCASMAFAFSPFLPVVNFGPGANPHTALGPKMDCVAQDLVALIANADPMDLTGLKTDRGRAGDALQTFRVLDPPLMSPDFAQ